MSNRTRIFYLILGGVTLSSCEQRDDQALIKVYEVFQRDMQARDDAQKTMLDGLQGQLQTVTEELDTLKKNLADSSEKLGSTVAEVVSKKLADQNTAAFADLRSQIELLRNLVPAPSAGGQAAQAGASPVPPPNKTPGPDGMSYRDRPPPAEPPPTSSKPKDPSRKTYRFEF